MPCKLPNNALGQGSPGGARPRAGAWGGFGQPSDFFPSPGGARPGGVSGVFSSTPNTLSLREDVLVYFPFDPGPARPWGGLGPHLEVCKFAIP